MPQRRFVSCLKQRSSGLPLVLLLACGLVSAQAASLVGDGQPGGRKLKQLTVFYETPDAAGSTSLGLKTRTAVAPDGTYKASIGTSVTSADALANPFLYWLTDGAYKNRPQAASTTYQQIPLALQSSMFPTLSYGLAEGRGDALSRTNGGWGNVEFGYNPLSNNLGTSISSGSTHSINVGANERVGNANPATDGVSGVEFAGYANDQTDLSDARSDQSGQAIAFPNNLVSPLDPLTCTQSLLYGVTLSNYDLGAPATPVPREDPGSTLIPYCLSFFNFGSLDDFANFIADDTDYELNFDNNGDGRVNGLRGKNAVKGVPGGRLFNRRNAPAPANATNTTTTTATITAPPVVAVTTNREQKQGKKLGSSGASTRSAAQGAMVAGKEPTNDGHSLTSGANRPVPKDVRARAILPQTGNPKIAKSFGDAVNKAVQNGPPELQAFAKTKMGSQLLDRFKTSPVAYASDRATQFLANTTARGVVSLAKPLSNLQHAANNFTSGLVLNATNLVLKSAVTGLETVEPLFRIGKFASAQMTKVANASNEVAGGLAATSEKLLQDRIAAMPEGQAKKQAEKAAATLKDMATKGSSYDASTDPTQQAASSKVQQQSGRRRMLH